MKKGIFIFSLLLVGLSLGMISHIFISPSVPKNIEEQKVVVKSYTNLKYPYSFNYPADWIVRETINNVVNVVSVIDPRIAQIRDRKITTIQGKTEILAGAESLEVVISNVFSSVKSPEALLQEYEAAFKAKDIKYKKESIHISGIDSLKFTYVENLDPFLKGTKMRSVRIYVVSKETDNKLLQIDGGCMVSTELGQSADCSTSIDEIMNTIIIPSFKFL